jgi:uncharacterized protein (DUF4415 family)
LKLLQQLELYKGRTLEEQLSRSINEVRSQASVHSNLLYQGEFLNEWQVTSSDKKLSSSTASLSKLLKDSVNTILSPRSSYSLLLRLDQEIKQQQILWKEWERKDTSFHADLAVQYAYGLLMDGMDMERQIIQCRLEASAEMEKKIRAEINPEIKEMGLDLQDLNRLRTMRQAYLNKMLNNKYTRSIKVYQSVLTNARNWKKNYQTRLKMLEEV